MFDHFQPMGEGSLEAQLIRITQDGTYVVSEEIFGLFCPLPPEKMAESVLMDAFVMGLAPKLKAEVVSRHPRNLDECMREPNLLLTIMLP